MSSKTTSAAYYFSMKYFDEMSMKSLQFFFKKTIINPAPIYINKDRILNYAQ